MGYLFLGSNSHVKKIILHEGTERIAGNAFEGCEITEIDIPESVVEIGSGAFRNCSRLTSVKLPQHLTSLSDSLFSGCTALKKVDIPEHITTLPGMLFRGTGIEEYTIPNHVTSMGAGVFSHCKMLRSVQFHKGISCISEDIFSHSGLKEFIVPEWMTEIGKFAFYGCEALQEVHMPEGIQIGGYAFCGCSALADEEGRIIVRDVYYGPKGGDLYIPVRIPETVQTISIIGENPEIMYRTEARNSIALPRIENVHVGDTFCFGSFPQDEDYHLNPITWKVLEVQDGKAFVLSEKCLVVIHDDLKMKKGTWADSALRKWLNTAFLESAFTKEEQSSIETTTVITPKNKKQHIDGGPDTQDKLFLLSLDEVERLMPEEEDKATTATAYAAVQRGNKRDIFFWLLRTPGKGWGSVAVSLDGLRIATTGNHVGQDLIRPAMVLKLS